VGVEREEKGRVEDQGGGEEVGGEDGGEKGDTWREFLKREGGGA